MTPLIHPHLQMMRKIVVERGITRKNDATSVLVKNKNGKRDIIILNSPSNV